MSRSRPRVLIVDDDEKILFAFRQVFRAEGYESAVARDGEEALNEVASARPDVVIMDITMPKIDGLEVLRQVRKENPALPVVLITGFGTMQTAIKAMQLGAFEYLTKPLDVGRIREVTRRALESTDHAAVPQSEATLFHGDMVNRYELVGRCSRMQDIYKLIGSISTTPNHTSVLVLGESGTGKELVARAIHTNSGNAREPFIPINCTVLPEALLESELFGHEKGAFTGAVERKIGRFEFAGGGTIFLDEIGNLSPHLQQKLLRVLQEREMERLGGNDPISVRARFIAATNLDLASEVKKKNFREDLYFRLNVVSLRLPPLRERLEDVALLANYFLMRYNDQLKKKVMGFSAGAIAMLQAYSFPGNVRELENLVERAVMLTKGDVIVPDVIADMIQPATAAARPLPISSRVFSAARKDLLGQFEKQFLLQQLTAHRGNVTLAARSSRMTRQNFQRLMTKHRIRADRFRK